MGPGVELRTPVALVQFGPLEGGDGGSVGALAPALVHDGQLGEGVGGKVTLVTGEGLHSAVLVRVVLHLGPRGKDLPAVLPVTSLGGRGANVKSTQIEEFASRAR